VTPMDDDLRRCPKCGDRTPAKDAFCVVCGSLLEDSSASGEATAIIPVGNLSSSADSNEDVPVEDADTKYPLASPVPVAPTLPPPPIETTRRPVAEFPGWAKWGLGCGLTVVIAMILLIAGCSAWWSSLPKNVGYDDVLTQKNAISFAPHHTWGDSGSEEGNTAFAQRAIKRLGSRAYGQKFGDLMDSQKAFEQSQQEQRQAAYYKAHPTPAPTQEPTETPATQEPKGANALEEGQSAILNSDASNLPCFDSTDSVDAYIKTIEDNDKDGFSEVIADHAVVRLKEGEHVLALAMSGGFMSPKNQLRITSGEDEGTACWIPLGALAKSLYSNVHE
jgi:hypothetical protein